MFSSMIVNTSRDLSAFLCVFICGALVGVVFDSFRAHRKVYPPSAHFLALQDAFFCAIAFSLVSHTVSTYADGDLRWYVFAGFFLGILLYFLVISKFVFSVFLRLFLLLKNIISAISNIFKKLLSYITKPFSVCFKKSKHFFCNLSSKTSAYFGKNSLKKSDKPKFCVKKLKKIFTTQKK